MTRTRLRPTCLLALLTLSLAMAAALTPAPEAPAAPLPRDPVALARAHAEKHLADEDGTLELLRHHTQPSGRTHVRFAQRIDGLEVIGGEVAASVDAQGRVTVSPPRQRAAEIAVAHATLSARRAATAATAALGLPAAGRVMSNSATPERLTTFDRDAYLAVPKARLVLFPAVDGLRTAWWIELPASLHNWYDAAIDARSGALLYAANRASNAGPEGEHFADDPGDGPPQPAEYSGQLAAPRDAWSDAGQTSGNNVIAGLDRDADLEPAPADIAPNGFSDGYRLSGGVDHAADAEAAINNVFYWMNFAHDRFYELGFTEAAGNFQQDNFGAGGLDGDPVIALVQWAAEHCDFNPFIICQNDAMFISQEDGLPGYAAFTLMEPPFPYVDGAFASDVVVHEYTHGVSHRLVGLVGGIHGFALGEGWSDFFAASFTGDPVFAEYWNGNLDRGIRLHSMADSPLTYADFCALHSQGCEGHADGEIWAATLWDIRGAMIDRHGDDAGIRRAEQLVLEGMMLTPSLPSFTEARDGILEADIARSAPDHCLLWSIFAARGLGQSAIGEGFPENTAAAAFDVPARCAGATISSDGDGMPDAYEASHACLDADADDASFDPDADGMPNIREWVIGTVPCNADTDGDHCGDLIETEPEPQFGGGRDPLDPWDFFDLDGDRAVTIADAMDVLRHFGAGPGTASLRDRITPDPARPWLTAKGSDGVDLIDALALLKSFGHFCAG